MASLLEHVTGIGIRTHLTLAALLRSLIAFTLARRFLYSSFVGGGGVQRDHFTRLDLPENGMVE
jgi:hypothetical protein